MKNEEFEALAERVLLVIASKGNGYTPPENAHMLVDTALAVAEDFVDKLQARREELDTFGGLMLEEIQMLNNSSAGRIKAITAVQERTGIPLADARDQVDRLESQLKY
jgi:ribosomal protein L7/L12